MSVEDLLDMMEEQIEEGTGMPFTSKKVVDAEKLLEIIDEIRLGLPEEMRSAQKIVNDRQEIVDGAHKEADEIIRKAEERARVLVSAEAVTKAAQQKAQEIEQTAKNQAHEMRTSVTEYCENMLKVSGEQLAKNAQEIKTLRENLHARAKNL